MSDLASGEPPRFAAASAPASPYRLEGVTSTAAATWSSVGGHSFSGDVNAIVMSGAFLYLGGEFVNAGGNPAADYVVRWNSDTSQWQSLGATAALLQAVHALAVGSGGLYVGGAFVNAAGIPEADYVAFWNGSSWSALGGGAGVAAIQSDVFALTMWGPRLVAGGFFLDAAGIAAADAVAFWDGSWHAIGSNGAGNGAISGVVTSLAATSTNLYVGGDFDNAGTTANADNLAVTTGSSWSGLGSNGAGNGAINNRVDAIVLSGTNVYVGGLFTDAGAVAAADYVARWNGSSWLALGSNGAGNGALTARVTSIAIAGSRVYVGGLFTDAAGLGAADYLARFSGGLWTAIGSNGLGGGALGARVNALAADGSAVYVGGEFLDAGNVTGADHMAVVVIPGPWSSLGASLVDDGVLSSHVLAIAVSGSDVYVGGNFTNAAFLPAADYIARWNGSQWSALGSDGDQDGALNSLVNSIAISGTTVYAGGAFTNAGQVANADYVARFDGTFWKGLTPDIGDPAPITAQVRALRLNGTDVFVAGHFLNAGAVAAADYVARWNGTTWFSLGSNVAGTDGALTNVVQAMTLLGSDVYVGGSFLNARGIATADYIARWNGSAWSALGSDGAGNGALKGGVTALAAAGGSVYAGGTFLDAANLAAADYVARWNGNAWSALGSDGAGDGALKQPVLAIVSFGSDIFVGGQFTNARNFASADYAARWTGNGWKALGANSPSGALTAQVFALARQGRELLVGGLSRNVDGIPAADFLASYGPITAYQPDGRIKKGSGSLAGDNIYNANGANQARSGAVPVGGTITFTINVQNDGTVTDKFKVAATGSGTTGYTVRYFAGTTEITSAVVAGTYTTSNIAAGASTGITARVSVTSSAAVGSSVTRLVKLTSFNNAIKIDAVKFTVSRA